MWVTKGNKKFAETDKVYSKYIRFKDAKNGYVRCITCGKVDPPEDTDCGHYISREVAMLRFDERNTHPQCRSCNRFHEGRKDEYALALIRLYGPNILEELNKEKYIFKNYSVLELKEMRKEYRNLLKELRVS